MSDQFDVPWHQNPLANIPKVKKKKRKSNLGRRVRPPHVVTEEQRLREENRPQIITLRYAHSVNGHGYGPGVVEVPGLLARELLNREGHVARAEEVFYGTKAVIIGGRDPMTHQVRTRQVPVETFDEVYPHSAAGSVSGAGAIDPGVKAGGRAF